MTSRLKRKLNDLGVDTASSKANENFCLIGTPLPPLEKSKDTGEFVPLWKQDVRDEKGRRRLHGAFTGGFSAGYFNTVGSKEGWAPSTFVSSRSERAKKQAARPEDFMDEEDLAELRESRNLIDENEEMELGGTEAEMRKRAGIVTEDDSMANALAASLAPSPQDSIGARILRKMGWRMGQGIGPRITYEQRRAQDRAARVGRGALPESDEGEAEEAKKHMYPRRDTPLLIASRKDNSHGLGYTPGMGLHESLGGQSNAEPKGPRLAAGFGLGALNDADEDDVDIYDGALRSQSSRRIAYDATDDDDNIMMGSSRHSKRGPVNRKAQSTTTQTFRDGRPVLKGFILADQPVAEERWFPLPDIPAGWKPNPKRVWDSESNKENEVSHKGKERAEPPKTRAEWKSSLLTADERGSMLGETPLPSQPRSVFEFMSQKDRERLEQIRNSKGGPSTSAGVPETSPPPPPPPISAPGELNIPRLHPSVAKAALSGFQPFTTDPFKQARYTTYLNFASSADPNAQLGMGPSPGQSMEDFNKELADYAKSATVFKPLSGAMASRFQSAVIIENGPKAVEGLHTPDVFTPAQEEENRQRVEEKKELDPKMAAVRLGMYGPLTREITPWQPARLLCKRFGVKEPEVEPDAADKSAPTAGSASEAAAAAGSSEAETRLAITDGSAEGEGSGERRSGPHRRNLANVGLGDDDEQGRDTLTYQRPAMDVFKAIFASDDEDSDDEEDVKPDVKESTPGPVSAPSVAKVEGNIPSHLKSASPAPASYAPNVSSSVPEPESVDLATFKPMFVPRSERESRTDKSKDKDRDKKSKKKKHAKTLVSFDTEEEGLQVKPVAPKREKHKDKDKDGEHKRKKRKEKKDEDDDDSMWVEKPAPEVVQHLDIKTGSVTPAEAQSDDSTPAGPPRGRKRAIDFM